MVEPGERAPDFALPRGGDPVGVRFYGQVGGDPVIAVFAAAGRDTAGTAVDELRARELTVHLVTTSEPGSEDFLDPTGDVHEAWGVDVDGAPVAVLLDANVRVAHVVEIDDVAGTVDSVVAALGQLAVPGADHPTIAAQAPVLLVPDAITPTMAERVIAEWEGSEPASTGVETTVDGRRIEALDHLRKRRRDHVVTDRALLRSVTNDVGRRVVPEVRKAFAFSARGFEGFKVGRYDDADEGFFAAHRDNLSRETARRRFALSINLNEDYDGGELVFPEYGGHRYRPGPREALVFSCSLLHAVSPVTRGHRFVLLSFLLDGGHDHG